MAALPPSFFFLSKLGLLSSVAFFGAWHVTGLFLTFIIFSWGVYYSVLRYFLSSVKTTSSVVLNRQRLSGASALAAVSIVCLLYLLTFFIDDVFFFVFWALI
jgi:hypothetical protein